MSFLSELLRWNAPEPEAQRFNDGTFQTFTDQLAYFQGQLYQPYMTTSIGEKAEPILENFLGYVQGAYKSNGVVFGISMARMLLFSDVRFKFRRLGTVGGGNDLFGNPDLRLLERPWPGGTTQQLLTRAEQDVTTAGTFFLAKSDDGQRLLRRRPDWMEFILDAPPDIAVESNVIGYKYTVGGPKSGGQSRLYLAQQYDGDGLAECIHWSPIPDPEACYRGMSWLSPVVKEILADRAATAHKLKFFENAATPNLAIALKETVTVEQFRQFMTDMNDASVGVENAYKNLYLGGGADVTVIGANMQQMTFKETQGAGETRMCVAGRVPPIIVGVSEGLSSATYSNYSQARRAFGDTFGRPQWKSFAGAVAPLINEPVDAELWYDVRDVAFLREDSADLAANLSTNMATINAAVASGWTPESAKAAVLAEDLDQLVHSGLMSVQLQPPGADDSSGPTEQEQASQEAATVATQATAIATLAAGNAFDLESIVEGVVGGDLSILEEMPEPEPDPSIDPATGLPVDPAEDNPNAPLTDDPAGATRTLAAHWTADLHPRGFHGKFADKVGGGLLNKPKPKLKLGAVGMSDSQLLKSKPWNDGRSEVFGEESELAAYKLLASYKQEEGSVTPQLTNLASTHQARMEGLAHRLKTQESLARKLEQKSATKGLSPNEYAKKIGDALRYTMVTREDNYGSTAQAVIDDFRKAGYTVEVENTWKPGATYKGINTNIKKDGLTFELQFHSENSIVAKGKNHVLYEIARDAKATPDERAQATAEMLRLMASLAHPAGAESVK